MNKIELLEYAIKVCNEEIEKEIKVPTFYGRFDRLMGLKNGLIVAETTVKVDWSEKIIKDFITNMIEHL